MGTISTAASPASVFDQERPTRQPLPEGHESRPKLREQLANQKVRFSMACNTLVMRSADSETVPLRGGGHGSIPIKPLRLKRGNAHDTSGRTRFYDRTSDQIDAESGLTDAEFLDVVADYMMKHPGVCNHHMVQLKVHGETDPIEPFPGWDRMPAEGIYQVLFHATEYDLMGLLVYELEVRPTQEGPDGQLLEPRDEVIDVLEDLADARANMAIVDADEAVSGL